jgi:hypothetical protein
MDIDNMNMINKDKDKDKGENMEKFFLTCFFGWYLYNFGPPSNLLILFNFIYIKCCAFYDKTIELHNFLALFFNYYNVVLAPEYFNEENDKTNDQDQLNNGEDNTITKKVEIRYEDKYLDDIRKMDKEFKFTEEEEQQKSKKTDEIYKETITSYSRRISEIYNEFKDHEKILSKYEDITEDETNNNDTNENEETNENETKEEVIERINSEQTNLFKEMDTLKQILETEEGKEKCMNDASEQALQFIIKQRLDKLKNNFVIENTPLGNVLMVYDNERGSFKFYSDNTVPYRYLEVVGRKYVKQFNCRPIFVDMEEELNLSEEKWTRDRKEKEERAEQEKKKQEENIKNNVFTQEKKNVFAKFKSYNKEAGTGHVNISAPPKNSIPNKHNEKPENEKILLKEKANRYTYEGKFANFNFLKKIERKVTDKKYALTFADFKKMQQEKK